MILFIFSLLLILNVIGLLNRKRAWSKIFVTSQVFVFIGFITLFNLNDQERYPTAKRKSIKSDTLDITNNIKDINLVGSQISKIK